jgi:malate dehydrogenase
VSFISLETGINPENIHVTIIGGHGDKIFPLIRYSSIAGIPLTEYLSEEQIKKIFSRTKNAGAEIVGLLKNGSAYYAPAYCIVEIIDAIIKDKNKIIPCSVFLDGEFGIFDVFLVLLNQITIKGVEKTITFNLNDEESKALISIADSIKDTNRKLPF